MLQTAMPRPVNIARGATRNGFDDETGDPPIRALTRDEAQALRAANPPLSPWRVIVVQAIVGGAVAAVVALVAGDSTLTWSAIYGAAIVVVPGTLMARGMTSRLSSASPGNSAVSVMFWSMVKIGLAIALLMLAPKLINPLSWPFLLAAMVLCMQVYWFALLWRGRS